jgi:hypothetical protein
VLHGVSKGPAVSENRCKNLPQSSNSWPTTPTLHYPRPT